MDADAAICYPERRIMAAPASQLVLDGQPFVKRHRRNLGGVRCSFCGRCSTIQRPIARSKDLLKSALERSMIEALAKRLCSTFDAFRISSFAAPTQANLAPEVSVRFFTRTVITQTVKSSFFLNSLRTLHLSVPLPKIRPHPKIAHLTKGAAYTLAACPRHRPPTSG
jgi:hypothetical protein